MTYTIGKRKDSMFLIVIFSSAILLSIPLISGHVFHSEHILHIAVHEAGFILAMFLTTMSLNSFFKTKISRMLFSAAAFGVLALGQGVYMYSKMNDHNVENMASGGEILDLCILIMTVLFAFGVFYKR
jgi:hypothetical protein